MRQIQKYLYHVITERHKGRLPAFIRGILAPLSWIYGMLGLWRGWLYDLRIRQPRTLPCAVISVGNIAAGGTGKTPTAIWIASYLQREGFRVAVLLRGYRRKAKASIAIVSDGKKLLTHVAESGDEAVMIARELPGVSVLVGKNRYAMGLKAIQLWETQTEPVEIPPNGVLILDDGFQYRQLARDLDIVTIDSIQPFGTGKLLPAGTRREPTSALRRADVIVLTRTDLATVPVQVKADFDRFVEKGQIFETCHKPTGLYELGTAERFSLDLLNAQRVLAVCGIGNPEAFAETLRRCEPRRVELLAFPDHHQYTRKDFRQIKAHAIQICADLIVTTQKDAQKLGQTQLDLRIFVLAIELTITKGQEAFKQRLKQVTTPFQKNSEFV